MKCRFGARSERKTPETLARIEVKTMLTGEKVILGNIAEVETRFDRDQAIGQQAGAQAIQLSIMRAVSADYAQNHGRVRCLFGQGAACLARHPHGREIRRAR